MNKTFTYLLNPKYWQIFLLGVFLVTGASLRAQTATRVSVFNYPNLNGTGTGCGHENYNLISIINLLPDYDVDASIVSFANPTLLADQLDASTFFFMTDMESQSPANSTFFPVASREVFRNWVEGGGVMVMTGTYGPNDTDFLNLIFKWDLGTVNGSSWAKNYANTKDTPFEAVTATSLPNLSATDAIRRNSVPGFTTMWGTDNDAVVAVIQYGAGYVIFMGFDFYNTGPSCPQYNSAWVQQIIPAALEYAAALSASISNNTFDKAELNYKFNQNATVHYILVPAGSPAPTSAQIERGENYGDVAIVSSGKDPVTANQDQKITFSDLDYGTSYDVYVVFKYDDGGTLVFSDINKYNFTTLPNDAPVFDNLKDHVICVNESISFDLTIVDDFPGDDTFTVSIVASNEMLFKEDMILVKGSNNKRNISLVPAEDQFGESVFTIEIKDSEGASTIKTFKVVVVPYPVIAYTIDEIDLPVGEAIEDLVPKNTGGEVAIGGWSISRSLPEGLHFDTNSGRISGTPTKVSPKTSYTVTGTAKNCGDSFTFAIGVKARQVITFDEIPLKSYGDESFLLGEAKSSEGFTITYTADDPEMVKIEGNQATILKAGSTKITASQKGDELHYAAPIVEQILTVEKVVLIVKADPQEKVYGDENPELTFQYSGWVIGEEIIDTPPSIMTTVDKTTEAGSHVGVITMSGGEDTNYTFDFVPGTFKITKAVLTVTADPQGKVYGDENPALTFQYSGWVNGEENIDTPPSISTTVDRTTVAGSYKNIITLSGGEDNNYTFDFVSGTLEVAKAPLTVRAEKKTKVYGYENPLLTFHYEGMVNGETETHIKAMIHTTATNSSSVGTYPITVFGANDPNYEITYIASSLEITQASLTIR
ncbi:MBG domain-containing protein, partial [Anditalea andensis]|uniref:MBG domain-containing protein n=1 Tax=Anditalea andensis TaxID=1048983 RepID=UPI000552FA42